MTRQRGVTLVELMVVVAVVAILAALGYPAYLEQQLKGRRADGKAMLNHVIQQSERFYTENNTFTDDLDELGFGSGTVTSSMVATRSRSRLGRAATSPPVSRRRRHRSSPTRNAGR